MSFGWIVCNDKRKTKFDSHKKLVKGEGYRGQIFVKNDCFLSCYLNNSKSIWPIVMSFGRIMCNNKKKAKFDSKNIFSKVKVTGVK